jgi:hypothetical protein
MQRRAFTLTAVMGLISARLPFFKSAAIPDEATTIWTTRDGRAIRICDMSDDHLRRTIFYLVTRYSTVYGYYRGFSFLPIEQEWGAMPEAPTIFQWDPRYAIMLREATRRRLAWDGEVLQYLHHS